jgi:CelD/BcsL family acetyltransferase involved in cellulose biosynthesis
VLSTKLAEQIITGREERDRAASPRLSVEILSEQAAFDRLQPEWDELLEESSQRVFFLRWDWTNAWWRIYQPAGSRLFIITCREDDGRLVGIAPFYIVERRSAGIPHVREVLFLGTGIYTNTSEYLDIIARNGFEQLVSQAVVDCLKENHEWDRLWLYDVPASSMTSEHLSDAIGGAARVKDCGRSYYIDTTEDWATIKSGMGKTMRANLDRHIRRFFRMFNCAFHRVELPDEIEITINRFVHLHQARWQAVGEPGSFSLPRFREFLSERMRESAAHGRMRMWALEVDGLIEAVLVAFLDGGVAHYFQGGFNPDYAKESLGTVMIGLCIKDCVEADDVKEFDFMGGNVQYKAHWTKTSRETVEIEWMRRGLRSLFYKARNGAGAIGKTIFHATVPATVRAARRQLVNRWLGSNGNHAQSLTRATAANFLLRQMTDSDHGRVKELIAKMSPSNVEARYEWLYEKNPHGRSMTWVAIDSETGETAGCTSIFPRRVTVAGRERMGSIGGDCFVEPRFRRMGLATALHRASFSEMRERGIDFMYGPPVVNNLSALVKAGSRVVTGYRRWVRPLTVQGAYRAAFSRAPSKFEARLVDLPVKVFEHLTRVDAREFSLESVSEFSAEFDDLFERAAAKYKIACTRDRQYLTWRYLASPHWRQIPYAVRRSGELIGLLVLETNGEKAAVIDLFTPAEPYLIDAVLELAIGCASEAGCSSIELDVTQGSIVNGRMRAAGFINRGERGFQVAVSEADEQFQTLTDSKSWHFMEADQDLDTFFVNESGG